MDSSPVLRQQSHNKIRSDFQRMKNEHNKMPADPKPFKHVSATHLPNKDIENQDPGNSEVGKKAPVRLGVSRLPVLAKSLRLQTPSDFTQSHCGWEDKPLAGKAKKKKTCTRPVPFNMTQPKSSRMHTETAQPQTASQSRLGTHAVQAENNACNARLKTQNINAKPSKHPALLNNKGDSTKGAGKFHGKATEKPHLSGQSGPSNTCKTNNTLHQNSAAPSTQAAVSEEACLDNLNLLSLKDPSKTSHVSQNISKGPSDKGEKFQPDHAALLSVLQNEGAQRVSAMKSRQKAEPTTAVSGSVKSVQFSPDPTALRSILLNEGVKAAGPVGATPRNSVCPGRGTSIYTPQRVSVMKSRQKAEPTTGVSGPVRSVQFSPDPAALRSILLNEGVKAGGPVGATPRNSVCPSGRGTSIYTAQRVPVRKNGAEATRGPVAVALKDTPSKKWTPQRVRDTKHQPMSSMKWNLTTPYTPGLRRCNTNLQPRQEEVVQRLFDDQEDEQSTNVAEKDPGTRADQLPVQASTIKSSYEENLETIRTKSEEDEENRQITGGQPFFQAPQRESVIFFSTGKTLLRAPRFEKQESSAHEEQHGPVSSEQRKVLQVHEGKSSEPTCQIKSLHRDLTVQKTCALSPAVAILRKRLPPLEELLMDEEVATFTSVSGPTANVFLPTRPRCGNPVASYLHFEESTTFVPIGFDLSCGSSSPHSSPLQER
ncbi:uncharacterized protein LOC121896470 isoform X1 [Thunnus maccoyii]|uniref:uncharacterized protein LOC121896470 isoform X1 n=1 Tax=Thunnus maccoyii TaxID=8240 RepID=UPI001C4B16A5|nr:uncharacterized protein LOC121896470 isoform X1 [Thunnus maccoyii]